MRLAVSELNQELDFSQPRGAERNFFGSLAFMGYGYGRQNLVTPYSPN